MDTIIEKILIHQNPDGSFNNPERFYLDKYRGTVWTLILLAELDADKEDSQVKAACEFILNHSFDKESGGFSVEYSTKFKGGLPSKVIPCLTGNMVFSLIKLGYLEDPRVQKAIDWIVRYQRTDDGIFIEPLIYYKNLKSCFSTHTCFMGVVKSLKALAEIPTPKRTEDINKKINELSEFMLHHHIYKKSSDTNQISKPGWTKFGFPKMYQTDVLEIMYIFAKLQIEDERLTDAIDLIRSKSVNGKWILETTFNGKMITSVGVKNESLSYLTKKAKYVLDFYG